MPGKFHFELDYMSRNSVDKELTTKQARISCLTGLAMNGNKEESTNSDGLEECTIAAVQALEAVTFEKKL